MQRLALLVALLVTLTVSGRAQTYQAIQGDCELGGQQVVTDGRNSVTRVMRSFVSCQITVYVAGTTTLASIASNSGGTPKSNPFTADSDGHWQWYALTGVYDVKMSGAGLTSPVTRSGYWITAGGGGGGGTVGPGTIGRVPIFNPSTTTIADSILGQIGVSELKFAATGKRLNLDSGSQQVVEVANESGTGTTTNRLAILTGNPSTATRAQTSSTSGLIGIVVANAGTTGSSQIVVAGVTQCEFDGATVAGAYVGASVTTAGQCASLSTTLPTTGVQVIGRVLSTNATGGTYGVLVFPSETHASNLAGSGTTNYLTYWTDSRTVAAAPNFFYDGATPEYVLQANLQIFTTNASSKFHIDTDQIVLEGSSSRPIATQMFTMKGVAGQTGDYERFFDSAGSTLYRVDKDGDVMPRGVTLSWPAANSSGQLTNNGSGVLTWVPSGGSVGTNLYYLNALTSYVRTTNVKFLDVDATAGATVVDLATSTQDGGTVEVKKTDGTANTVTIKYGPSTMVLTAAGQWGRFVPVYGGWKLWAIPSGVPGGSDYAFVGYGAASGSYTLGTNIGFVDVDATDGPQTIAIATPTTTLPVEVRKLDTSSFDVTVTYNATSATLNVATPWTKWVSDGAGAWVLWATDPTFAGYAAAAAYTRQTGTTYTYVAGVGYIDAAPATGTMAIAMGATPGAVPVEIRKSVATAGTVTVSYNATTALLTTNGKAIKLVPNATGTAWVLWSQN